MEKEHSGEFIKFIAYLQIIGIVLVVLGHSFHEYPDGQMGKSLLLYRMLFSFRMPLFLFVSGFLMLFTTLMRRDKEPPTVRNFISGKLRRLMLPFIVLTLVTFIPRASMSGMADDVIDISLKSLIRGLTDGSHLVIPLFWFLQASFLLLSITYLVLWIGRLARIPDLPLYGFLISAAFLLPFIPIRFTTLFSINEAVRLAFYFLLGTAYCRWSNTVDQYIHWESPIVTVGFGTAWCFLFFITENTAWIPLCSVCGIGMCISIARIIERRKYRILDHLVGANYLIFLLSWYCNVISQQVLAHFVVLPWWIHTVLSLISGIYIPWLAWRYIQNHPDSRWVRFTALLLGQKLRRIH